MKFISFVFLTFFCLQAFSNDSLYIAINSRYNETYSKLDSIIKSPGQLSFKKAVFITENAFLSNSLEYTSFDTKVKQLAIIANFWGRTNGLKDYKYSDSVDLLKNYSIYRLLKDTINFLSTDGLHRLRTIPFIYDFSDYTGEKDWTKNFISKLLFTYSGNCHSLPFLYKILADELGAKCWLSLAPNHIYIKNRCKGIGWYNTELTSGSFPIDAWITASGYVPLKAVQTGLYMDTLSNQQAIALCVLDLAKGYEHQTKNYYDGFILKCCDLVLKYHSVNPQALLLKAETLKKIYEKELSNKDSNATKTYKDMEEVYLSLYDLGYREMPERMYLDWLRSIQKEQRKYANKEILKIAKGH